jgi:hypothetical protein
MNPIVFAMRCPLTVMVPVAALALGSGLALLRMPIDIFPNLNLPVVYAAYRGGHAVRSLFPLNIRLDSLALRCVSFGHFIKAKSLSLPPARGSGIAAVYSLSTSNDSAAGRDYCQ